MGDDTVNYVANALADIAFANNVGRNQVRPIADAVVNMMRNCDMSDEEIEKIFYHEK